MKKLCLLGAVLLVACGSAMDGTGGNGAGGGVGGSDGSGGGGSVKPDWVSGSRLRARIETTDDGGRAFAGWYDPMTKVPCAFQIAADGKRRCLPTGGGYAMLNNYFRDANCTVPLAQEYAPYAAACAPAYVLGAETMTPGVCNDYGYPQPRTHVYAVGAVFTGAMIYTPIGADGACEGLPPSTAETYFDVGAEIPAATFATGSVVVE